MSTAEAEIYQPKALEMADRWREFYNPLVGLNLKRIVAWLYQQQMGIVSDITWLYRFIERRDAVLMALVQRRTSALKKLDWNIKTIPEDELPIGSTKAQADAQAVQLRNAYDAIDNLRQAVDWMGLATFRGFSHLEKHYDAKGKVIHLEPVPQWNWARAGLVGDWFYNKGAFPIYATSQANSAQLTPIETDTFLIREVEYPVDEIAVIAFMRKNMSQKDWDAFVAIYGIPPLFAELPPNAPAPGTPEGNVYQKMVEKVVGDTRGVLPSGAKMTTVDAGSRGKNPFLEHLRYQDEQIVLAGTGGKLTMLTESGSGTLAGGAHADTFDEIAEAEAMAVSEIFQKQFDELILAEAFPGQPILAYFELEAKELTDASKVVADVMQLAQAGYEVDLDQLEEKTGYRLSVRPPVNKAVDRATQGNPDIDAVPATENRMKRAWRWLMNRAGRRESFTNRTTDTLDPVTNSLMHAALRELTPKQAQALQGVLNDFERDVLAGDDAGLPARMNAFSNRMPGYLKAMNVSPVTASVLQNAFTPAYLNGLLGSRKATR